MNANVAKKLPLWEQFEIAAKDRRRNPQKLLADFMQQCLESWEDERLFEQVRRQARRSGYKEKDAVALVKEVRQAKRRSRGHS